MRNLSCLFLTMFGAVLFISLCALTSGDQEDKVGADVSEAGVWGHAGGSSGCVRNTV